MYRFFVEPGQIADGIAVIAGPDAHHIRNVLRMKKGETILLSCGDEWEYTCEILDCSEGSVRAAVTDIQKSGQELPCRITLFQCLPKKEKMELIIQKSIELGVARIVPVASSRCVVRLDPKKAAAKTERWNAIARAAAKQSKRLVEPEVAQPAAFSEALRMAAGLDRAFLPYERAENMAETREAFGQIQKGDSIGILIGPEGGFEEKEAEEAVRAGLIPVTLGRRILRTETAGPAVLAMLVYLLEE